MRARFEKQIGPAVAEREAAKATAIAEQQERLTKISLDIIRDAAEEKNKGPALALKNCRQTLQ